MCKIFLFLVLLMTTSVPSVAQNLSQPKVEREPELYAGQCSQTAFEMVQSLIEINRDAIAFDQSTKSKRALASDTPEARVQFLPDKTESWEVSVDYYIKSKRGKIIVRKVVYQIVIRPFDTGFCEVLETKKISKQDSFSER